MKIGDSFVFSQFRHPDITSEAHVVFAVIGLALFAEVRTPYRALEINAVVKAP